MNIYRKFQTKTNLFLFRTCMMLHMSFLNNFTNLKHTNFKIFTSEGRTKKQEVMKDIPALWETLNKHGLRWPFWVIPTGVIGSNKMNLCMHAKCSLQIYNFQPCIETFKLATGQLFTVDLVATCYCQKQGIFSHKSCPEILPRATKSS